MPIKIQCGKCQATLNVNDKMAGKQGKCPKCSHMIAIPSSQGDLELQAEPNRPQAQSAAAVGGGWGSAAKSPMDDLLDEAGVQKAATGPTCPNCAADMELNAVLCVECGYNQALGRQVRTQVGYDHEAESAGMTENEKIMAKAEREVASAPITIEDGDHGDGADSFLIAIGMAIVFAIVITIGVAGVFFLDQFTTESSMSMRISFFMCVVLYLIGHIWLMIVGFMENVGQGLALLFAGPLGYSVIYGLIRFRGLWIPTLLCLLGEVGANASYAALVYLY